MELYKQKRTDETPEIYGSVDQGVIKVDGICRPSNSIECFREFISWISYFSMAVNTETIKVEINLDYMNTSSGMIIYRILSSVKRSLKPGQSLYITWIHEKSDSDMRQVGEDFKYMLGDILKVEAA